MYDMMVMMYDGNVYSFSHSFLLYYKSCIVMSDYSTVFCDDFRGVHENYGDAEGDKMKQNSAV
jgi:hypothetical protein